MTAVVAREGAHGKDARTPAPAARSGLPLRVRLGRRLGHLAETVSRSTRIGSGGVIGGRVLLALAPRAFRELAVGHDLVLVSGTNGKTTTTAYLTACLRTLGDVETNADGANTRAGLARTLADASSPRVVLETDEGWLPWVVGQLDAPTAVLLNLSRDQLHRHHEVARLAGSWRAALAGVAHAVANADDPAVVMAARAARSHTWVGVGLRWAEDTHVCPRCGGECHRSQVDWWCGCGLRRPSPHWWLDGDDLVSATDRVPLRLGLPGSANLANAALAVATAAALGADPHAVVSALHDIGSVAGRYETFRHRGRRARLILAKNPASWFESLDMVSGSTTPLVLAFNSDGVDGRDPSWLYDVGFTALAGRPVVVTGRRSTDLLVRLEMDGLDGVRHAPDVATALEILPAGDVQVIANYTAFQEARQVLAGGR